MTFFPTITEQDKQSLQEAIEDANEEHPGVGWAEMVELMTGETYVDPEVHEAEQDLYDVDEFSPTYQELKALFATIPVWELDVEIKDAGSMHPGAKKLRDYWVRGEGALKIRWGVSGDFNRCTRQLRKYVGVRAEGLCANYHKAALGTRPGEGPHV